MLTLLMILALGASAPRAVSPSVAAPRTLQCTATNTSDGKDRKCHVRIRGRTRVRSCEASEKAASHCALDRRMVAWVVGANGAHCELSKKKTDWKKSVAVKVAKETKPGAGSCTLFVTVQ